MMIPRRNGNGLDFWDEVLPDSFFTEKESKLMKTDLKEKDGKYFLEIDIPGYEKEDIKIELHDGYLTVSAEKNEEKEDKHAKYLKRERFSGMCSRSYYVGENVNEEDIKANFRNGILTIEFRVSTAAINPDATTTIKITKLYLAIAFIRKFDCFLAWLFFIIIT